MEDSEQVLIVLDQEDVDQAIHGIEQAGLGLTDEQFKEQYGTVYQKLHAIDKDGGSSYRVK